jgi:hypothetical protein
MQVLPTLVNFVYFYGVNKNQSNGNMKYSLGANGCGLARGCHRRSGRCDREADDEKSSQKADAKLPFSPR